MFNKRKAAAVAKAAEALVRRPICGCGHHWSHHDGKGTCHFITIDTFEMAVVERKQNGQALIDENDQVITSIETKTERIPCTCQRYYGPIPHPEFVVPPLAEDIEG